jgi:energy-coupling factor transport system substrate-specific component
LVTGIMQGLGVEIVFAARRWQDYSLLTVILAGAVGMLVALPWNWYRLGYFQLDIGFLVLLLIVRLLSGAILSGLVAKVLGDALARTGVLSNFALGRARQEIV